MNSMHVVSEPISLDALKKIAEERFGDLVKGVVDIEQKIMVLGGEFHADEEVILMDEKKSKRENTWGINLYPAAYGTDDFIEFDSMINLKPFANNRSRGVEDEMIQKKIREIVTTLIIKKEA